MYVFEGLHSICVTVTYVSTVPFVLVKIAHVYIGPITYLRKAINPDAEEL